ncbi:glycine receptor subunit alpha-4-like [Acanthaster planci]|uniref:Glycine receptor subunit alpha-4-like n=1 Tax=Acanthaster planci TaxID=133434 RepID=A0A8B7YFY7_ACAPL|nr:glycine receptor subunit alpha-4-like [Acanthaster planci]
MLATGKLMSVCGIEGIVLITMVLLGNRCQETYADSGSNETVHSHEGLTSPQSWVNHTVNYSQPNMPNHRSKACSSSTASVDESQGMSQSYEDIVDMPESSWVLLTLMKTYDKRIRPNFGGLPTIVACSVFVLSMDEVTEVTMDYGMTILLEEYWNDPRLAYANISTLPYISSGMSVAEKIWVPDLFFANEKRASFHEVTVHNRLIRVYPDGDIFYSMKLSLVLYCHMDFKAFPMDKQRCKTAIESYQSTEDELIVLWKMPNPVAMATEISLPQYSMQPDIPFGTCQNRVSTGPSNANFSCIQFSFTLVRELTFYIIQTYIPTSLLVLISWVSFWIDIGQAAARVSLGVTTVLTMTTTTVGYGAFAGLPKVSYTKAIDLWFDACLSFVIGSLFEYAVVHYLWTKDKAEKHIRWAASRESFKSPAPYHAGNSPQTNSYIYSNTYKDPSFRDQCSETDSQNSRFGSRYNYQTNYRTVRKNSYTGHQDSDPEVGYSKLQHEGNVLAARKRCKLIAIRIDRLSRVFFPVTYVVFVITYWVCYYRIYVAELDY